MPAPTAPSTHAPVVLVHGLFGTLRDPDVAGRLGHAVAPDLLGYGTLRGAPVIDLLAQAERVREAARVAFGRERVHVVGHSIGGVVAMLVADLHPEETLGVVSVEGNFTLADAFWSAELARSSPTEVERELASLAADPAAWLARSAIEATPENLRVASSWLTRQPASTVHAMARSAVGITGHEHYLERVRSVLDRVPVHLVAGERSRAEWHVPQWVVDRAASFGVVAGAGHLLSIEQPDALAAAIARATTTAAA